MLHVLLHLAESGKPETSDTLARMAQTNPVVIRRVLGGLREQGLVQSEKGHGGGWRLSCDLDRVTLYDIYVALGEPTLLAMENRAESPGCLVEEAVNAAMNQAFQEAEALLLERFREVTLAQLSDDFRGRLQARMEGSLPQVLARCAIRS